MGLFKKRKKPELSFSTFASKQQEGTQLSVKHKYFSPKNLTLLAPWSQTSLASKTTWSKWFKPPVDSIFVTAAQAD